MALPLAKLGTTYDGTVEVIDPERAKAYAAATNDPNPTSAGQTVIKNGRAEIAPA